MPHKTIALAFMILLFASFVSLALIARDAKDPNLSKNWWAISFVDIHNDSLNFTIDNHSNATHFTYAMTQNDMSHQTPTTLSLPKGESATITLDHKAKTNHPTTITVWSEENIKDTRSIEK
jgi:hypothetical protein